MDETPLLRLDELACGYPGRTIISGLSRTFNAGIHGLMGANGSGKSTLLKTLAGILPPLWGRIAIAGHDLVSEPLAAKRTLAYVPVEPAGYPFMTGQDLLRLVATTKRAELTHLDEVCARYQLAQVLPLAFSAMSSGMRRKVFLVAACIGSPTVILLDEPSDTLDAHAREELIGMLGEVRARAVVLVASHDAELLKRLDANVLSMPL